MIQQLGLPCDVAKAKTCLARFLEPILDGFYRACPPSYSCGFKVFEEHLPQPVAPAAA